MAEKELVIKIPEDVYTGIIGEGNYTTDFNLVKAFKNAVPLPAIEIEDAISRSHALSEFKRIYFDNDTVIRCAELVLGAEKPVSLVPKIGRWIFKQRHKCVDVCCSECGYTRLLDYSYNYTIEELEKSHAMDEIYAEGDLKFCENCGAKMEREVE